MTKKIKMKRINYAICGKYRKFKNAKIWCIFEEILFIILSKCENDNEKYLKKKNQLRY